MPWQLDAKAGEEEGGLVWVRQGLAGPRNVPVSQGSLLSAASGESGVEQSGVGLF